MSKFNRLKSLHISKDATAKFPFEQIEGSPTLHVRPATDANKDFFNAILKADKSEARELAEGDITDERVEVVRAKDAAIFVEHIVDGWEGVLDDKGVAVPFTKEDCLDFLLAIPADMFNHLRMFCMNANNFRNKNVMSPKELKALTGN